MFREVHLKNFKEVVFGYNQIQLSDEFIQKVGDNFNFLQSFSKDKVIYGVNTGFGPMAQYKIENGKLRELQYNLIRSHASGAGDMFPEVALRAIMFARLCSLAQVKSGVHPSLLETITQLLNLNVLPVIYEHGGVGASGDLVQLAHLALCLIGEGEVLYQGKIRPTAEVFAELNIEPINIYIREGLALLNGTSAMTGVGLVNLVHAYNLLDIELQASCVMNEIVSSFDDHYSKELNQVKGHSGQNEIASMMREKLLGASRIKSRHQHLYKKTEVAEFKDKVQEYYSLRCIPQILGPILDCVKQAETVLLNELNSANDNPVIDSDIEDVFHGGNFHGDYVSFEMDKLKIAMAKLSILSERHVNFLCNSKINNILPPFVNQGVLGLNMGVQGIVFTAASTTAENQMLANPMYVHSIPNNNDNMDVVSMGCNAANITNRVINNTYQVIAIELITMIQGIDCLKASAELSKSARQLYGSLREITPNFVEDIIPHIETKKIEQYMRSLILGNKRN
ncbi:aromatic amino acid ammonia-lyase [Persicobacter psychrovividus]|uniref:Histidine ammonia-lyase n=1 Tax=Persicobacter psychrovividus TaxID=387638 RepID=A0ABN6LJM1_9BACT|nr:histidine ammonia-lyase [Persicobacter psychrovividus]